MLGAVNHDLSGWHMDTNDFFTLTPGWFYMEAHRSDGYVVGFRRVLNVWRTEDILKTKKMETPEERTERIVAEVKARRNAREAEVQQRAASLPRVPQAGHSEGAH